MNAIEQQWAAELDALAAAERRRYLRRISSAQGPQVTIEGRRRILACSNDYLGLAADSRLVAAAEQAMAEAGFGAGASRLVSGSMDAHHRLEAALAAWKQTEAAVVFNSGYHANIGTIGALVGPSDIVYSDALNHASIIDGVRLSRAQKRIYPHADTDALAARLAEDRDAGGRRLIVTDSIFSMDGDAAPLATLCTLAERYGAILMIDEAHAAGVLGPAGRGLAAELDLAQHVHVQMGTLGKALGSFGAYVAGSQTLIDLLVNKARSLIFTTALPPAVCAAATRAVDIVRAEADRRRQVLAHARRLRESLRDQGWHVPAGRSPILPVIVGADGDALALSARLWDRGIWAACIRPPTVPEGTARIRLTVTAAHTRDDVEQIAAAFAGA